MNNAFSSLVSHRKIQRALTMEGGHLSSHDNYGMKVASYIEFAMVVATYMKNLDIIL